MVRRSRSVCIVWPTPAARARAACLSSPERTFPTRRTMRPARSCEARHAHETWSNSKLKPRSDASWSQARKRTNACGCSHGCSSERRVRHGVHRPATIYGAHDCRPCTLKAAMRSVYGVLGCVYACTAAACSRCFEQGFSQAVVAPRHSRTLEQSWLEQSWLAGASVALQTHDQQSALVAAPALQHILRATGTAPTSLQSVVLSWPVKGHHPAQLRYAACTSLRA